MPNAFAYLVLFSWPAVAAVLFSVLPRREALIWTILGGYLLLPSKTEVNLPLVPTFDKTLLPSLAAALLCLNARREARPGPAGGWLPASPLGLVLAVIYLFGPFATAALNGAPMHIGGGIHLAGHTLYDSFSFGLSHAVLLLPFLLGRRHLADPASHTALLRAFVLAGLAYSLPMLFEVRMSPQLHTWIYGFFPHDFSQMMRDGGFRPVVFLGHGLLVALYAAMSLIAAVALWRTSEGRERGRAAATVAWLAATLVFCRTLGALALGAVAVPVVAFLQPRAQLLIAAGVAVMVIAYPALRSAGLAPVGVVVALAERVNAERASSFVFRLDNEDRLLAHANARPIFGWGGWGRGRVYDPETGRDVSVTDGRWIITIGGYGWTGYVAEFGLLTLGVLLLARRRGETMSIQTAALGMILAVNLIDLIPNSGLTPLTWLIAGALLGEAERRAAAGWIGATRHPTPGALRTARAPAPP